MSNTKLPNNAVKALEEYNRQIQMDVEFIAGGGCGGGGGRLSNIASQSGTATRPRLKDQSVADWSREWAQQVQDYLARLPNGADQIEASLGADALYEFNPTEYYARKDKLHKSSRLYEPEQEPRPLSLDLDYEDNIDPFTENRLKAKNKTKND